MYKINSSFQDEFIFMKDLIIHIGLSKCASSTIQAYLGNNPTLTFNNKSFKYVCFKPSGKPASDAEVMHETNVGLLGYCSSNISRNTNIFKKQINHLKSDEYDDHDIIISNEDFGNKNFLTKDRADLFKSLNRRIKVVMFVRPFAEWMASGWWQWGFWEEDVSIDQWVSKFKTFSYLDGLQQWLRNLDADEYYVSDISNNVLQRFAEIAGMPDPYSALSKNRSSSAELLNFLIKHPYLGRKTHNPRIEFYLNRNIKKDFTRAPFPLSRKNVEDIFTASVSESKMVLNEIKKTGQRVSEQRERSYLDPSVFLEKVCDFDRQEFISKPINTDIIFETRKALNSLLINNPSIYFRYLSRNRLFALQHARLYV